MWCLKFIWLFVYILFLKCTLNQVSPCLSIHSALHLSACEQMCTDHFPLVCLFKKNSIGCYIFIRLNRQIFNISTEVKNPVSGCMQILVTIVIHLCTLSPHSQTDTFFVTMSHHFPVTHLYSWIFSVNISVLQIFRATLLWRQTQVRYSLGKCRWWRSPPRPSPRHHLELRLSPTQGRSFDLPPEPSDRRTSARTGECTSPSRRKN